MTTKQESPQTEEWIALVFDTALTIAPVDSQPVGDLSIDGVLYRDCRYGALPTFYDRLVDRGGQFVGVQFWPAISKVRSFFDRLASLPYVHRPQGELSIEIYWHDKPTEGTRSTAEQAFGGPIFQSDQGVLCVTIDFQYLSGDPVDKAVLMGANARFSRASVVGNPPGNKREDSSTP